MVNMGGVYSAEPSGYGWAANFTMGENLLSDDYPLQLHFLLSGRVVQVGDKAFLAPYALFRLETWRFYLGVGATPWAFKREAGGFNFNGVKRIGSHWAYHGQLGLIWRMTSFFHLSLEAGAHFLGNGFTGGSMKGPAAEINLQMRFPFDIFLRKSQAAEVRNNRSSSGKRRFDGVRYPFGIGR